jgi:hypothetical protein
MFQWFYTCAKKYTYPIHNGRKTLEFKAFKKGGDNI